MAESPLCEDSSRTQIGPHRSWGVLSLDLTHSFMGWTSLHVQIRSEPVLVQIALGEGQKWLSTLYNRYGYIDFRS